jgi:hypothetical protein
MALKRVWIPSPNYSSRGGSSVRIVVVHTAEGATTYQSLGNFFANRSAQVSSHTGIDDTPNTIGEYVKPPDKAWTAAAYNPAAIQTELCGFASWTPATWAKHPTMLENCAAWIREECQRYGLPIVKLNAAQAQAGGRGVCGHVDLGRGGGGHWDPGPSFPWTDVINMAKGGAPPTPEPAPPKPEEIEMIASAVADNGSLHTFVVGPSRKAVWYTWQKKGQSGWNGGAAGKQVAKLTKFADAPGEIRGISAELNDGGVLHVFVTLNDGSTVYTWQPKGETAWNGSAKGKIASLTAFAPAP